MGKVKVRGRRDIKKKKDDSGFIDEKAFESVGEKEVFFVDTESGDGESEPKSLTGSKSKKQKITKSNVDVGSSLKDQDEAPEQSPFFGIVDRVELEYFKQAESTLAANAFSNNEERDGFVASVLQEARGKELKLVTNQICSKLVERLILSANDRQILNLFKAFSGNFLNLSKHKYSSHCVETLLVRSAALIEREMLSANPADLYKEEIKSEDYHDDGSKDEQVVSMENLFIFMVNEIKSQLTTLAVHAYASHVIRLLLLILSGSKLPSTTTKSSLRSKKSKIARKMISINDNDEFEKSYQVPTVFKENLHDTLKDITNNITTTTSARELSIHKIASPLIQLIVKLESADKKLSSSKKSITRLLIDINSPSEESYIEYLLSDPIGLYFFEAIITDALPVATVERLYKQYMGQRINKLVKRDSANFIVPALLQKLKSPEIIKELIDAVIPELDLLINSNNLIIVKAILSSAASNHYKVGELTDAIFKKYSFSSSNDNRYSEFLEKMLKLEGSTLGNSRDDDWPTSEERHRALFVEALVRFSPKFLHDVSEGFIELPQDKLLQVAKHSVFSHVLQSCLVPESEVIIRRRLLNNLMGSIVGLSCNAYGSHIVDSCWKYTYKLKFFRERIAEELIKDSTIVKNSMYGKMVWKNWSLDKYIRKRFEWWNLVKLEEDAISESLGQSRSAVEAKQRPAVQKFTPTTTHPERRVGTTTDNRRMITHGKKPYDRR